MTNGLQTIDHKTDAVTLFKNHIARQEREFRAALPAHIPVDRFLRVLTTAVINNPDLLGADRRSLFEFAMKAAQDGLLPDGREGALVIFNTKIKGDNGKDQWIKKVQWMPMVAGILKKVRNSGELQSISAHVVFSNDDFSYALGDDERIDHRPALDNRGAPRLLYAIAKLKDGGIYREIMTVDDVEKVRAISRAKDSGPWVVWWAEMARKTVLRRLSKRLPMSSDLDELIRRGDYDFEGERGDVGSSNHLAARAMAETPPDRLTADLDAIAAGGNPHEIMGNPPHNPETGEIESNAADMMSAELMAERLVDDSHGGGKIISDPKLVALLDKARAMATNGVTKFNRWQGGLSAPDYDRLGPYLDELRKAGGGGGWDANMTLDFYCRRLHLYGDPTDECYMLNRAARFWWLTSTWPGWSGK